MKDTIKRKIVITIDGDFGGHCDTNMKVYENGKKKTRWTLAQMTFTGLTLMDFAMSLISSCNNELVKIQMEVEE